MKDDKYADTRTHIFLSLFNGFCVYWVLMLTQKVI